MGTIAQQVLYPPLVEAFMPAFIQTDTGRIYFSKTNYNIGKTITHVQLSLNFMSSNRSALNDDLDKWSNGIKLCELKTATPEEIALYNIAEDYKYYIEINPNQMVNGSAIPADLKDTIEFATGVYYKAQLRFSSLDPVTGINSDPGADWFSDNIDKFSEWSRVCLIKGIPQPVITMKGFRKADTVMAAIYDAFNLTAAEYDALRYDDTATGPVESLTVQADRYDNGILASQTAAFNTNKITAFDNQFIGNDDGYGSMTFIGQYGNSDTSEPLKSYVAELYKYTSGILETEVFASSGTQYPISTYTDGAKYLLNTGTILGYAPNAIYNGFYHRFNTILLDESKYRLVIRYLTKNGYSGEEYYDFATAFGGIELNDISVSSNIDSDNGRISLNITGGSGNTGKNLLIRRADYKNNFVYWEDIFEQEIATEPLDIHFHDYTIESGIFYQYWVGGSPLPSPVMAIFDDIFLIGNNKQLKIEFNPQISTFKYAVSDNKTETLGGQFPFIRRNGNIKYREFSINGLISALSDENSIFVSDTELYDGYENIYSSYNGAAGLTPQTDYIKEKKFRDKVLDFLYDGQPKLFKSTTEGNIIVRLTEISLTPLDGLGRMLYSFTASATEIDEFSFQNCKKYGLEVI